MYALLFVKLLLIIIGGKGMLKGLRNTNYYEYTKYENAKTRKTESTKVRKYERAKGRQRASSFLLNADAGIEFGVEDIY